MVLQTIAFLYPGAMGASLARTLSERQPHLTLLTNLDGRSSITRERAKAASLIDTPVPELVHRSDVIISILPPSPALIQGLGRDVVKYSANRTSPPPIFIDANAVSPNTLKELNDILRPAGIPLIDGCVIGLPAKDGHDPKVYLSSAEEYEDQLNAAAEVLSGGEEGKGLKVQIMHGAGEGAASALKMCYGGINKGATGLAALMILAAHAHSPETADALLLELGESATGKLDGFSKSIPDMIPKAYRFVDEMAEDASFIRAALGGVGGDIPAARAAETYEGLSHVFQRIADDIKLAEKAKNGEAANGGRGAEVGVLLDWASKGKQVVEKKKRL